MKFRQIVDCVDINKQPAFDHPLLKNHKLQVLLFIRTNKEDLIQMKYYLSNHTQFLTQGSPGQHYATLYTKKSNDKSYNGVNGHIEIYNPRLRRHQMSLAQIAVENGEGFLDNDNRNTFQFGGPGGQC
ncbi:hypothetical protein TanjilG_11103 [Lupinus angustifolius]|uniref:Neprosin activation peptide domain-containing protein n=1 Tax=Lupinus angustifolius TaxID=3871 RepID=A0A394DAJ2_LUPAN|nr:hypothetical protein TanjilG_11103 [Lupinus angustifolius]